MREREVFTAALRCDSAQRDDFLRETCAGNDVLRERVERLLESHQQASAFLTDGENSSYAAESRDALAGDRIDRYLLLEQIGEGGFGVVYLAEQQAPVQRQVALKIIRPGMDSRQVVARFEAERQALAMMDHPNISRVLDAGATKEGLPYFVMELVLGKPIVEFCNEKNLSTYERLRLFHQVCMAIQHAHQKGVIHRDIKPSNVLVTMKDETPVPKVIDFGIAKAISQQLTEKTLFTRFGQMVGTPQYMSPEQAEMNDLDIDTRTDVYSLGALLYELLTGCPPLDADYLRACGFAEMLRIIQVEEPPTPSSRISTQGTAEVRLSPVQNADLTSLRKQLVGDIDWIVMKALEKDRTRRYATVAALADDVQRHMSQQPVSAGPPTTTYRLSKFVKRNRAPVLAGLAIAATAMIGIAGVYSSRNAALAEAAKSRQTLNLVMKMFRSVDPTDGAGPNYSVRTWLDEFSAELDDRLADQPADVQAEVLHTIGLAYIRLNMQYSAKPHIMLALQRYREHYGDRHKKTADCLTDLAMSTVLQCDFEKAQQHASKALSTYEHLDLQSSLPGRAREVLHMAKWSHTLRELIHEETMDFRHEQVNEQVDQILEATDLRPVGTLLARVYTLKLDVGDFEAAEALSNGRITETLKSVDNSPLRNMTERMGKYYLGTLYQSYGRHDEAQALFLSMKQHAMNYVPAEDNWMHMMYAWALLHCGECADAETRRALDLARKFAKPLDEPRGMSIVRYSAYHTLAAAEAQAGHIQNAITAERTALETISPQHLFHRGQGEVALAGYLIANEQPHEAEGVLQTGVAWRSKDLSPTSLQRAVGEMNLAEFYLTNNDEGKARPLLQAAAARLKHHALPYYHQRLAGLNKLLMDQ